jgi:hypothetical protein
MNELSCNHVRDVAAEAALDMLAGDERTFVFDHLENCLVCRSLVESYVRVADSLLVALPEADVPDELSRTLRAPHRSPRKRRIRLAPTMSIAATLILVVGLFLATRRPANPSYGQRVGETAALVSPSGGRVGSVTVRSGGDPSISMSIDGALSDGTYECQVLMAEGDPVTIGQLIVGAGHGWWEGPLEVDPTTITAVRVVGSHHEVAAVAGLHP